MTPDERYDLEACKSAITVAAQEARREREGVHEDRWTKESRRSMAECRMGVITTATEVVVAVGPPSAPVAQAAAAPVQSQDPEPDGGAAPSADGAA